MGTPFYEAYTPSGRPTHAVFGTIASGRTLDEVAAAFPELTRESLSVYFECYGRFREVFDTYVAVASARERIS